MRAPLGTALHSSMSLEAAVARADAGMLDDSDGEQGARSSAAGPERRPSMRLRSRLKPGCSNQSATAAADSSGEDRSSLGILARLTRWGVKQGSTAAMKLDPSRMSRNSRTSKFKADARSAMLAKQEET